MIGQTISHYTILEKLGEGGMGVVYKATDTRLDRTVALKFLPPHRAGADRDRERFIQEARTAAGLSHPGICTIHDVVDEGENPFIVMECVEGETLRSVVARSPLPPKEAIGLATQIADALEAAHAKGIVHRDVKSENIMLTPDGRAKVMDFGLARLRSAARLTRSASTVGTLGYMSPEQVQGQEADARSDLFSLGVVLYEMLAGRLPFPGEHEAAMVYAIVNQEPDPLERTAPNAPAEVRQVVAKALEKNPAERYQSARELAVDLRRAARDSSRISGVRPVPGPASPAQPAGKRVNVRTVALAAGAAVVLAAAGLWYLDSRRASPLDSIAVLPFVNTGADQNMEYLSDGITESLINSLSRLPQLKVMSRSSVFRFKGDLADPQNVGRRLGVRAVLFGRIQQRNDDLLISTELIDVADNTHLWGEQYNRKSGDILAVQEEISREISRKLGLRLADKDSERLARRSTENTEAYQLYLKGRYHWNKRSADGLQRSVEYFQRAVDEDPGYALAFSGMADAYAVLGWFEYGIMSPQEVFPKAKAAARRAVELDPDLAEAYVSLAWADLVYDRDHTSSAKNFKRALELNPSYATAHQWYAELLASQGNTGEAIEVMKHALVLDPLSLIITRDVGWMLYFARRYREADGYVRKALDMDPNFMRGHLLLGQICIQQGLFDQAISELETASRLSPGTVGTLMLAYCQAAAGRVQEADSILGRVLALSSTTYVPPGGIAMVYGALGNRDKAFEWLNRALDEHCGTFFFIKVDPMFDGLRGDPRFSDLLGRAGILP